MDIKRAFQIFDLDPKSSAEAIKQRYYDLAAVWHPDHHSAKIRLNELASEKMKEINSAYEIIRLYLKNHKLIVCYHCGANSIKHIDSNIDYAICNTCGKQLKKPSPKKQKIPCASIRCAGTIGSNKRCNYCGKTIEEGRITTNSKSNNKKENNKNIPILQNRSKKMLGKIIIIGFTTFTFAFLIRYVYKENIFFKIWPPITNTELPISRSSEQIPTSDQIARKPSIFKSNSQPITRDISYYSTLFKNNKIEKEEVFKLQKILRTLGYGMKKPDGLLCEKTILCLKQYSTDFGYLPEENFPYCFFKHSFIHYQVASEHNDWMDIFLTNDLENWIHAQSAEYQKQIYNLELDKPNTVIQLIRKYKFEKLRPLPTYLPETGVVKKNFSEATGNLKIRTKTENNNYYIKLIDLQNHQEALSAFIRSGSTLSVHVPFGVYDLKYSAGHNWYGLEYLFGSLTSYGKLPALIILTERENQSGGLNIELIPNQYGKLTTEIISEFDF